MVIQDTTRAEALAVERESVVKFKKPKPPQKLSVFAVQSIACVVVVLLAVLLRMAGGEAYHSLRHSFHQALARNEWATALSLLWDENPLDDERISGKIDVKDSGFTGEKTAPLSDA